MAKLVIISKGQPGLSHTLGRHWVTIGRAPGSAFQILESSVSGNHCEVQWRDAELIVRDLRSTNGTFVNGAQVAEGVVKVGETLRVGDVELRLEASPDPVEETSLLDDPPATDATVGGETSQQKVSVLLVDDSMAFLEMTTELFAALGGRKWEVHQASAADRALSILDQERIDLVVLDIVMPMLDGTQLLKLIHQRYPHVKKVILTGNLTESARADCLANGAELFFEKPTAPDGFQFIFNVLSDLLCWSQREGFTGTLRQVELADIIQIECLGGRSCILQICSTEAHGEIYIESGSIVHANAGTLAGDKAFQKLLSLIGGDFHLQHYREPAERTVRGSWEYLLMEAARVRDEERTARATADTLRVVRKADESEDAATANQALPSLGEDLVVVSTYDGQWRAGDATK